MSYYNSDDHAVYTGLKIVGLLGLLAVIVLFWGSFFSHTDSVHGQVTNKWVEQDCSSDSDSKVAGPQSPAHSCTNKYMFQLDNGEIYMCWCVFGSREWDVLRTGDWVSFKTYGYSSYLGNIRVIVPYATDIEVSHGPTYLTTQE